MAYDSNSGGTVGLRDMCPVFGLPGVISQVLNNSASATDVLVDIPWKTCRLAAAYTVVTTAIDADTGGMQVTLELNAAGGGDMMAIDIAASGLCNLFNGWQSAVQQFGSRRHSKGQDQYRN
jgi:hypothetical protein